MYIYGYTASNGCSGSAVGLRMHRRGVLDTSKSRFYSYYKEFESKVVPSPRGFGRVLGLSFDSLSLQLRRHRPVLVPPVSAHTVGIAQQR
jgi:hypothetical protein